MADPVTATALPHLAAVAVPVPLRQVLHYLIPDPLLGALRVGQAVRVPFGRRRMVGWILSLDTEPPEGLPLEKLRAIQELLDPEPVLPPELLPLLHFARKYYHHPVGEVVRTALPAGASEGSHASFAITAQGRNALQDGNLLAPNETELLQRLSEKGPARRARLAGEELRLLKRMAGLGHVELEQHTSRKALQAVRVPWVELSVERDACARHFSRKGPVRERLLDFVQAREKVRRSELLEQFSGAGRILKQLHDLKLIRTWDVLEVPSDPLAETQAKSDTPPPLTSAQGEALDQIVPALEEGRFTGFLLWGITGSGKTEVYLRACQRALELERTVLVLVPEIGLTPQLLGRFRARFGTGIAVLHSELTERQRYTEWERLRLGSARIAVGARSAIFAPLENLGLIVVDEEHDGSYKQDDGLRYSARDLALVRGKQASCPVVLGSATPSIESYYRATEGRGLTLLELPERAVASSLPSVEIVDLTRRGRKSARKSRGPEDDEQDAQADHEAVVEDQDGLKVPGAGLLFSRELLEALEETLTRREQAIILLNRRGLATYITCTTCGGDFSCPHCDISLTYHGRADRLMCHACGFRMRLPTNCPACSATSLQQLGRGTERVEELLQKRLPGARIDRMDRDTTRSRGAHARILDRFRSQEIDILVGTQMVAKGHDFPRVTLVGVLHADAALHLPDFRAAERTFSLLTQVAGRAGRGSLPGRVLIQTYHPNHYAIRGGAAQDYPGFFKRDLRFRRALGYPPFGRVSLLRLSHPDQATSGRLARDLAREIRTALGRCETVLVGPAPSVLHRLQGRYRWQILLKSSGHAAQQGSLTRIQPILDRALSDRRFKVSLDVDPIRML